MEVRGAIFLIHHVDLFLPRSQPAVVVRGARDLEPIPFSAYRHDVLIAMESRQCLYKLVHYLYHH